jgi:glycolate oxidase iron-sulfur subunit
VRAEPRALLRSIPGLELVELADGELCCGSAGSYNLTEPGMAWRLGERKAAAVLASGADMVAAGNPGCILQIRAALRLRGRDLPVLHPVEILARAQGID